MLPHGQRRTRPRNEAAAATAGVAAVIIRRATPEDAHAMSRIATDTFVETFGHLYPPEDLAYFLLNSYSPAAQREMLQQATTAQCLMTGAPSPIPDAQLAEVHVAVRPKAEKAPQ